MNNPDLLSIGLPSAIGAATARSVAKMFDFVANNGSIGSQQLLSSSTVAGFLKPPVHGLPNLFYAENTFVRGMILRMAEVTSFAAVCIFFCFSSSTATC